MTETTAPIPRYVLLEETDPISVPLVQDDDADSAIAIYAFSDKQPYDTFCAATPRPLRPYPLVKGYLKHQLEDGSRPMRCIAIDAVSPAMPHLNVASLRAVLDAFENKSTYVATTVRQIIPANNVKALS